MKLGFTDVASAAFKATVGQVPLVSGAVEFVDNLQNARKVNQASDAIEEVRSDLDDFLSRAHEKQGDIEALSEGMGQLEAFQKRNSALMFGGLIRGTDAYQDLIKAPNRYGKVLTTDSQDEYDPDSVHLMIEGQDGSPLMLKMNMFTFFSLLGRGVHKTSTKSLYDQSDRASAVATPVPVLGMDSIDPSNIIIVCTNERAKSESGQKLLSALKETYGIEAVFPEEMVLPGENRMKAFDRIANFLIESGFRPVLIGDEDLEETMQFQIVDRVMENRRTSSVLPLVPIKNGEDFDMRSNLWRGLMAAPFSENPTDEEIRLIAASAKGLSAHQMEILEEQGRQKDPNAITEMQVDRRAQRKLPFPKQ